MSKFSQWKLLDVGRADQLSAFSCLVELSDVNNQQNILILLAEIGVSMKGNKTNNEIAKKAGISLPSVQHLAKTY